MISKNLKNILILISIPLFFFFLWLKSGDVGIRFSNPTSVFRSIGQILGILGFVLFSLSLILESRFSFLEKIFGGLNKVYNYHHIIGAISFILLLFHPIFLAFSLSFSSYKQAALFLLPGSDISINFGRVSLILMFLLIFITFFAKLAYEKWKFTHKFLGVAFMFGFIHSIFVPSDISNYAPLTFFALLLGFLGVFSFLYQQFSFLFKSKLLPYRILEIKKEKGKIWEIELTPQERGINFIPGQFVFVSFPKLDKVKEKHPFSITSSNRQKNLKIAIKELGDWTSNIKNLNIQDPAIIEGPYGNFYSSQNKEKVFIAGGIGITPFLSFLRSGNITGKLYLFYSVKDESESAFLEEIEKIALENKEFKFFIHYSKINGHIKAEDIIEKIDSFKNQQTQDLTKGRQSYNRGFSDKEFFICGPIGMIKSLKNGLVKMGVPKDNIFSEEFQFYNLD
jgi:predicted ferric reductase